MNNNSNYQLLKINGEYVKFYVTTNSALPQLLKNSGSLVILHDEYVNDSKTKKYEYNSEWLGGQLIASGWGFHDESELKSSQWWANSYNSILDSIKKADEENHQYTYDCTYNYLLPKIENFVVVGDSSNIGQPERANVSYNFIYPFEGLISQPIWLKDIFKFLKTAEYDKAELLDYDVTIFYKISFDVANNNNTLYSSTIDKETKVVNIPVYAYIKQIHFNFEFKNNDTAGMSSLSFSTSNKFLATSEGDEETSKMNFNEVIDEETNYSTYNITHGYSANVVISNDYLNNPTSFIKDLLVTIQGTPESKYKVYPSLANNTQYNNYYSVENIIEDYEISLDDIKIQGKYYTLFYETTITNNTLQKLSYKTITSDFKNIWDDLTKVLENGNVVDYKISNEYSDGKCLIMFSPTSHRIKEIRLYSDNDMKDYENITGLFIKVKPTGRNFKIHHDISQNLGVQYDIYYLALDRNDGDLNLRGTIRIIYYNDYDDVSLIDGHKKVQFAEYTKFSLISNEDYECHHWLSDLSDFDITNENHYNMLDNYLTKISSK